MELGFEPGKARHVIVAQRLECALVLQAGGKPVAEPFDRRAAGVLG
jgi:hypothetical protein